MMLAVHDETNRAVNTFYPPYDDRTPRSPDELGAGLETGSLVHARSSGFVRTIAKEPLVEAAAKHDVVVQITVRPGDHVVRGTPIAVYASRRANAAHRAGETSPANQHRDNGHGIERAIRDSVTLGYERTLEQDVGFGFRQLEDVAVKALSPGINDPVTAGHAIGHMSDLTVVLAGRRLGPTLHEDDDGVGRVVIPDRDLRYYLDLSCSQVRRYGTRDSTVLAALMRLLRDVATAARDDEQRAEIERQVRLVLAATPDSLQDEDKREVDTMAQRVRSALRGDVRGAYDDRSGETRSM